MSRPLTSKELQALTAPPQINPNLVLIIYSVVMVLVGMGIGKMIWG
jgi:hypothetical protein